MLGEDGNMDERPDESFIKCLGSSNQQNNIMPKTTTTNQESHAFEIKNLCVDAGCAKEEEGKHPGVVPTNFEEELKFMKECLTKPKICEDAK
jgi:hypothetical protein